MEIDIVDLDGVYMLRDDKLRYWMGFSLGGGWEPAIDVPWPGHQPPPGWMTNNILMAENQKLLLERYLNIKKD